MRVPPPLTAHCLPQRSDETRPVDLAAPRRCSHCGALDQMHVAQEIHVVVPAPAVETLDWTRQHEAQQLVEVLQRCVSSRRCTHLTPGAPHLVGVGQARRLVPGRRPLLPHRPSSKNDSAGCNSCTSRSAQFSCDPLAQVFGQRGLAKTRGARLTGANRAVKRVENGGYTCGGQLARLSVRPQFPEKFRRGQKTTPSRLEALDGTVSWSALDTLSNDRYRSRQVEVAGIEPASLDSEPGLLRAQLASRLLGPCARASTSQTDPVSEKSRTHPETRCGQQVL